MNLSPFPHSRKATSEEMLSPLRKITHSPSIRVKLNSQRKRRSVSETRTTNRSSSLSNSDGTDFSTDMFSRENICKQRIQENVDKLGRLADKCEQVNSKLVKVVAESHKILDNSFLASQVHLTEHVTNLNYDACLDIGTAFAAYSQFVEAVQELVQAEEEIYDNLLRRLEKMEMEAQMMFQKASESKYHMSGDSDSEDTDKELLVPDINKMCAERK